MVIFIRIGTYKVDTCTACSKWNFENFSGEEKRKRRNLDNNIQKSKNIKNIYTLYKQIKLFKRSSSSSKFEGMFLTFYLIHICINLHMVKKINLTIMIFYFFIQIIIINNKNCMYAEIELLYQNFWTNEK